MTKERNADGWTLSTLKAFLDQETKHRTTLDAERDLRAQQRFDAQNLALEAARIGIKGEVEKALESVNKRLELLNELRTGVATVDQLQALEKLLQVVSDRVTHIESSKSGSSALVKSIYAGLGAVLVVLSVIVMLSNGVL